MKYVTRKGGATVTILVPWDCGNNCPFCVNKKDYEHMENFSLEKIIESIGIMDSITPECDFVISGGEPLSDLKGLQRIIDSIPPTHRIFINTTIPVSTTADCDELYAFVTKNKDKITEINVSRHIVPYVVECADDILKKLIDLGIHIRVNCVLFDKFTKDEIFGFFDRMTKYVNKIQLRANYTNCTLENLYDLEDDEIFCFLTENLGEYTSLGEYRMRCGYAFKYKNLKIEYHKTLPYSTIKENGANILYDIILRQTGLLTSDWNEYGVPLDIEAYRNVEFEEYK
jgi:organic radical activating enzyme